jgi:hypothetical protein
MKNSGHPIIVICRQHIKYFPQIVEVTRRMIEAAKLLDMNVWMGSNNSIILLIIIISQIVATEQNPRGLGHTVQELELQKHGIPVFEKTKVCLKLYRVILCDNRL